MASFTARYGSWAFDCDGARPSGPLGAKPWRLLVHFDDRTDEDRFPIQDVALHEFDRRGTSFASSKSTMR